MTETTCASTMAPKDGFKSGSVGVIMANTEIEVRKTPVNVYIYIDGHESKPAIFILAIVEKSQQTSNFRSFATYSFHLLT